MTTQEDVLQALEVAIQRASEDLYPARRVARRLLRVTSRLIRSQGVNARNEHHQSRTPAFYLVEAYSFWPSTEILDALATLLDAGADANAQDRYGRTPLHIAAGEPYTDMRPVMELLLRYGADIDAKSVRGWTPLFYAVLNANVDHVDFLLKKGAAIDVIDSDGKDVFHYALLVGCDRILALLRGAERRKENVLEAGT